MERGPHQSAAELLVFYQLRERQSNSLESTDHLHGFTDGTVGRFANGETEAGSKFLERRGSDLSQSGKSSWVVTGWCQRTGVRSSTSCFVVAGGL